LCIAGAIKGIVTKSNAAIISICSLTTPFLYTQWFTFFTRTEIPGENVSQISTAFETAIEKFSIGGLYVLQQTLTQSIVNINWTLLILLTPFVAIILSIVFLQLIFLPRSTDLFLKLAAVGIVLVFVIVQIIFTSGDLSQVGTIPRIYSPLIVVCAILCAAYSNSNSYRFSFLFLPFFVFFIWLLINMRLFSGWQELFFYVVQGGWMNYAFN
jgi:hypothetical protein